MAPFFRYSTSDFRSFFFRLPAFSSFFLFIRMILRSVFSRRTSLILVFKAVGGEEETRKPQVKHGIVQHVLSSGISPRPSDTCEGNFRQTFEVFERKRLVFGAFLLAGLGQKNPKTLDGYHDRSPAGFSYRFLQNFSDVFEMLLKHNCKIAFE